MLYLNEILAAFGLILVLIILVRLSLWLLQCNLCNNSKKSVKPNNKKRKIKKSSQNLNKKNDDENSSPPTPVMKPGSLEDLREDEIKRKLKKKNDDAPLKTEQPKFVIASMEKISEPDLDPRLSLESQEIVINMDQTDVSEQKKHQNQSEESGKVKSFAKVEIIKPKQENLKHTYAQGLRNPRSNTTELNEENFESNKDETIEHETIEGIVNNEYEIKVSENQFQSAESKMTVIAEADIYDEINSDSIEIVDLINPPPLPLENNETEFLRSNEIPAHRCICPYCSSSQLNNNRTPSQTPFKNSMNRISKFKMDSEEKEVLNSLDKTLEEMERLNRALNYHNVDHTNYSKDSETELDKISDEVSKSKPSKSSDYQNNNSIHEEKEKKDSPKINSNENEESSYYTSENNGLIKIDPVYKQSSDVHSTLIRDRIRVYEPDHPYPRIVPNWISSTSDVRGKLKDRPLVPPKPRMIRKQQLTDQQLRQKTNDGDIIINETAKLPQCAIYAQVVHQIKKRENLNTDKQKKMKPMD